ncbi:MAG: hypothetical protein FJ147_07540 [Deltaproteobacteria bacterium]|nr:hypothetical protein [Deltaproteobacteria bacterium]
MGDTCHKAQEIDLSLFLLEPQSSAWQEFRAHYPHCATCSAELRQWTTLEQQLRSLDDSRTPPHPSAETLVTFHKRPQILSAADRVSIAGHLRACAACREEVKLLSSFDFSLVQKWAGETKSTVTIDEQTSWSTRFWDTLRSVFFHPAFAFGLVLLLAVPFVRSYYSSSFNQVPISSDVVTASAPTAGERQRQAEQKKEIRVEEEKAAQSQPSVAASAPLQTPPPSEKAKEDTAPAKLAKQPLQREDLALKDERAPTPPPPAAPPAPSVPLGAGTRDVEKPIRQESHLTEEKTRQAPVAPPAPAAIAEGRTNSPEMLAARKRNLETREARSTEGEAVQQEHAQGGASFAAPATSVAPQIEALARGKTTLSESDSLSARSSLTETYKNAYEARDLNTLGQVWNVDLTWREALRKLFTQSQHVSTSLTLNEEQMTASADQRQISIPFSQTVTTVNDDGQTATYGPFFCIADLRKQNTGTWRIQNLEEDPQHPGQCRMQP